MGIARADCASAIEVHKLQLAELQGLFALLVNSKEAPGQLLVAAAQQQLVPNDLRTAVDWTKNIRILHNIMVPSPGQTCKFALPKCKLTLTVRSTVRSGKAMATSAHLLEHLGMLESATHSCQAVL